MANCEVCVDRIIAIQLSQGKWDAPTGMTDVLSQPIGKFAHGTPLNAAGKVTVSAARRAA